MLWSNAKDFPASHGPHGPSAPRYCRVLCRKNTTNLVLLATNAIAI